jgi:hypothetical protein
MALPTNIRLGLTGTTNLAYCEHSQITVVKKFITLVPVIDVCCYKNISVTDAKGFGPDKTFKPSLIFASKTGK